MAEVWAAEDLLLHRRVAVKVFRFGTPGVDAERIRLEMYTLAQLSNPGIVTVHDAGTAEEPNGAPYLVMEFVDGQSLAERLAAGPMPAAQVAQVCSQLAATLTYLHDRGVVHRDIKPANILLQTDAGAPERVRTRLSDFGVARLLDSTRITSVGMTIGTANYLSPEQATGAEVGPPADIYALGLVLIECLTGEVAYPGVGVEVAAARLHRPPNVPGSIDSGWIRLLRAMTANEPAARPSAPDIEAQLAQLANPDAADPQAQTRPLSDRSALQPAGTLILPGSQTQTAAATRSRRSWWGRPLVWAGAAAGVIVALILAATLTQSGGSEQPSPRARPTTSQSPTYPTVPGQLGRDVSKLEDSVG
jgi:serine/threonine protein kinase